MIVSCLSVCEPATIATSMAIDRPDAIGAAPLGRSVAEDGGRAGLLLREE
jgi:hypothetical protein